MRSRFAFLSSLIGFVGATSIAREALADEPRSTTPSPTAEPSGVRGSKPTAAELAEQEEADATQRERRAADEAYIAAYVSAFTGTRLVGAGSTGRYRLPGGNLLLEADRFFDWPGFTFRLEGFFVGNRDDANYLRVEGAAAARVARWEGAFPGGVAIYAGIGGDTGRYWFSEDGRFFPYAAAKARVWLNDDVALQLRYTAVPVAIATGDISLHEHRIEVASGWRFVRFGARATFTFANGGVDDRTFAQKEIGGFVGLGVFE